MSKFEKFVAAEPAPESLEQMLDRAEEISQQLKDHQAEMVANESKVVSLEVYREIKALERELFEIVMHQEVSEQDLRGRDIMRDPRLEAQKRAHTPNDVVQFELKKVA